MGDFTQKFARPDAGITTVEGNVAGARAMRLERERQQAQQEFEQKKNERQQQHQNSTLNIHSKFQTARIGSAQEQAFRSQTVGLVTAEEFTKATLQKEQGVDDESIRLKEEEEARRLKEEKEKKKAKKRKREKKKMASLLSFGDDADELQDERDDTSAKQQRVTSKKDPTIDTSFLPDQEREQSMKQKRLDLEKEWKEQQSKMQKELLEIVYSYWDGSGHRRTIQITKGSSVGDFLEDVRQALCGEFKELSSVGADALMYVKEDLILPQDITFYDLIATKARGKSGPLFHFDVHDDVRVSPMDVRVEKDESHPGKVVERRWYERNKHIFPASRWEIYDPSKTYGKYTIGGGIVTKKA